MWGNKVSNAQMLVADVKLRSDKRPQDLANVEVRGTGHLGKNALGRTLGEKSKRRPRDVTRDHEIQTALLRNSLQ